MSEGEPVGASDPPDLSDIRIRLLRADESPRLGAAIRTVYGETYDSPWVYDAHDVGLRISDGRLVSCIAESVDGDLLCHTGLSFHSPRDLVGHAGQAVTLPAARGHHLFTATKMELVAIARTRGLLGMYSEATAAHPYSQMANVKIGAQETGFLLGWIPAAVSNDAAGSAASGRQSAALFYLRTNRGVDRPAFVPRRHRDVVHQTIVACQLHARLADPPAHRRLDRQSVLHTQVHDDHNVAIVTVTEPGADIAETVDELRSRLFEKGLAAFYVDLPLDRAGSAHVAEPLEAAGLSYAGVFPNSRRHGDVLRLQSLNGVVISAGDVSVASDHGRDLLDYVLADLGAAGHEVVGAG